MTCKEAHNGPIRVLTGPVTRFRIKKFKEELNGMVRGVCEQAKAWRPIEGMEDQVQGWKMMIGASNGLLESSLEKCDRSENYLIDQGMRWKFFGEV